MTSANSAPLTQPRGAQVASEAQLAELRLNVSKIVVGAGWLFAISMPFVSMYHGRWPTAAVEIATAACLLVCGAVTMWLRANPLNPWQRFVVALTIDTVGAAWVIMAGGSDAVDINPVAVGFVMYGSFAVYGCRRVILLFILMGVLITLAAQLFFPDLWMVEGANWARTLWFEAVWLLGGTLFYLLAGQIENILVVNLNAQAELASAREREHEAQRLIEAADAARRDRETAEIRRKAEQDARAAAEDHYFAALISRALESLADGDLTARMSEHAAERFETIRTKFNGAMERLQRAMNEVARSASAMRGSTSEIVSASDDLAQRTEHQASSLEQTSAALNEITGSVHSAAGAAKRANSVVTLTRDEADKGGQIVREAVAAMSQIEGSSKQISQIIGVIDEIAFQTNLLALNAGVEAARAGEAGRGFAVVASEVRALAQRSADAAKEIKTLISASTSQVGVGVDLVGRSGAALQQIEARIAEVSRLVAAITESADSQAHALKQIGTAVEEMDKVTQSNAAMVEQTTAASHQLSSQADALTTLIGYYRLEAGEVVRAKTIAA